MKKLLLLTLLLTSSFCFAQDKMSGLIARVDEDAKEDVRQKELSCFYARNLRIDQCNKNYQCELDADEIYEICMEKIKQ